MTVLDLVQEVSNSLSLLMLKSIGITGIIIVNLFPIVLHIKPLA
jgi:hypothetical protein